MAPDAEDCETVRLNVEDVPVHHGRRILPDGRAPATAWTENEEERPVDNNNSPGESRRLLPSETSLKQKSRLQAGLTLGVHPSGKYIKCPQVTVQKKKQISKFEKRKEKLLALLKPPYFIASTIVVMICIHVWVPQSIRLKLEWSPEDWWQSPWRLLTYGLLHATVSHLSLNALVGWAVCWPLEREQRWWRVMIVWAGGLAAGALGAGALQPKVHVVGASAAVYALLTAHIANVCLRFGHIPLWWFRPLSVIVLSTSEMCWTLLRVPASDEGPAAAYTSTSEDHVAWSSHILGAAVGIPLAFIVFTGENRNKPYVVACRLVSGMLLMAGIAFAGYHYTDANRP